MPKNSTFTVTEPAELMAFLLAKLPHKNRTNIKSLLSHKQILVNGVVQKQFNLPLQPSQVVDILWDAANAPSAPTYQGLKILFEDDYLIVIDKEAGLLSVAVDNRETQTAYNILNAHVKKRHGRNQVFVVHRLDRDTSGVMLFAKSEQVKLALQAAWGPETKERTYLAVVEGVLDEPTGTISSYLYESKAFIVYSSQDPARGQLAVTHYETLNKKHGYSLLKVNLETGRKNQIRVHLQDVNHPIAGDKKYGAKSSPLGRLGLHAWILGFVHPMTNEKMRFETPIPKPFLRLF
jgi:23S rRNA pseudouridine1911/1915/1917 synthase